MTLGPSKHSGIQMLYHGSHIQELTLWGNKSLSKAFISHSTLNMGIFILVFQMEKWMATEGKIMGKNHSIKWLSQEMIGPIVLQGDIPSAR